MVRGLLQMLAIGLVLVWLLKGAAWWSVPALATMCAVAAGMTQRRLSPRLKPKLKPGSNPESGAMPAANSYWLCLRAIGTGSAVVIATMALTRVIAFKATALVPLGSMIIANSMNTCAQVLERYASDLKLNAGGWRRRSPWAQTRRWRRCRMRGTPPTRR